eukprot:jgi/Chrzof1/8749/Cz03g23040.t1
MMTVACASGTVIWANQSGVILNNVSLQYNKAAISTSNSSLYLIGPANATANGTDATAALKSSLVWAYQSTVNATNTSISYSQADILVRAIGKHPHQLSLKGSSSRVEYNKCHWVFAADSWELDSAGRNNLLQQPTTATEDGVTKTWSVPTDVPVTTHQFVNATSIPSAWIGKAPTKHKPLSVLLNGLSMSHNKVHNGLLSLRLVQATLINVTVANNTAQHPVTNSSEGKGLVLSYGAAALDVYRCAFVNNTYHMGALLYVTKWHWPDIHS